MKARYEYFTKDFDDGSGSWAYLWDNHKKVFLSETGDVDRLIHIRGQTTELSDFNHIQLYRLSVLLNQEMVNYNSELENFINHQ